MPENKSRFVVACQQLLALGTVAALAAPAAGVVNLDIVHPDPTPQPGPVAAAPAAVALVASAPVEPEVTEVPVDGVEKEGLQALTSRPAARRNAATDLAALSAPEPVEGYATVGVTWNPGEHVDEGEISVSVRSLQDGEWGDWEVIEYHDDHGPDPDSPEGRKARQGTDPIVVGDVDEVQVKIETADGEVPAGTELALVDPKDTPAPRLEEPAIDTATLPSADAAPAAALTSGTVTDPGTTEPVPTEPAPTEPAPTDPPADAELSATVGVTPKPKIFSRAQWGADERMRDKSSLRYYEVHAGFVHHTVNANNYTRDQVPSLLRGIYAYHTQSKGWSDIGYNFVVDRFGRIWEGRYGGVDRPVVGAHTLGYNEYSFAMSALGNFDTARPPAAMLDAYGRLFAWKLSLHGVAASDPSQQVGSTVFRAINGHRDAGQTACPGKYLYGQLGTIRDLATKYQKPFTSRARSTNVAGSPWPDLVVRDKATRKVYVVRTGGQTNFQRRLKAATGWNSMDLIASGGDLTGDGLPDVVARTASTGMTGIYPGTTQGTLGARTFDAVRFKYADQLAAVGDLTGDGNNDLVARIGSTKRLFVYPGNGRGGFRKRVLLSRSWGGYDLTAGAGDLDGDGRPELLARAADRLWAVPVSGTTLGTPRALPGRWGRVSTVVGGGDVTNDGKDDLVAQVGSEVYLYPGDGQGSFGRRLGPFTQFRSMTYLGLAHQLAGSRGTALIGRRSGGAVFVYPNNGNRNVESVTDSGLVLKHADLILNVGDWNGDGYGDIITRAPVSGYLHLRTGNGRGGFAPPVLAAKGFKGVGLLAAVGDITGDGRPDLMGQPPKAAMRIYPGNGSTGLMPSYVAHSRISSDRQAGLGLWDADGSPDTLVRRSDGTLSLYPGNGPGGLMNPRKIGSGAGGYDWLQSLGDATGDGRPDLVGRDPRTGVLWLLPGTRTGFAPRRLLADGFGGHDLASR